MAGRPLLGLISCLAAEAGLTTLGTLHLRHPPPEAPSSSEARDEFSDSTAHFSVGTDTTHSAASLQQGQHGAYCYRRDYHGTLKADLAVVPADLPSRATAHPSRPPHASP